MDEYKDHYSVLNQEVIQFLTEYQKENPIYADMTFGAGGHTFALANSKKGSKVYCVDQDPQAFNNAKELILQKGFEENIHIEKMNFEDFPAFAIKEDLKFDGIILDLGVSSHHFDSGERGFSFKYEAQLDMRMDTLSDGLTAKELVNSYSEEDLVEIFQKYGEEKFSKTIAKNIIETRSREEIVTTKQLEDIIFHSYPKKLRFSKTHPATKVFQALRIAVNRELDVLEKTLQKLFGLLNDKGRLAVISFHSLEDRIVKHEFKKIYQNDKEIVKILTKRPLIPTDKEIIENKRSRSAKLRVIEKNHGGFGGKKKNYSKKQ